MGIEEACLAPECVCFALASACGGQSHEFQTSIQYSHQLERTSQQHGAVSRLFDAHTVCRLACLRARHHEIILPVQAKSPAAFNKADYILQQRIRSSWLADGTARSVGGTPHHSTHSSCSTKELTKTFSLGADALQLLVEVAQHSTAQHSMGWGQAPGVEEVLSCVKNIRQVAMLLQQPGRRFKGPQGPNLAATCIQAHWRYALHSFVPGPLGCHWSIQCLLQAMLKYMDFLWAKAMILICRTHGHYGHSREQRLPDLKKFVGTGILCCS